MEKQVVTALRRQIFAYDCRTPDRAILCFSALKNAIWKKWWYRKDYQQGESTARNGVAPSQVAINKEYSFYFAPKNWAILTFSALKRAI
jgi:hypothetical protein